MNIKKNLPKLLSATMSLMILCGGVGTAAFTAGAESAESASTAAQEETTAPAEQGETKETASGGEMSSQYNKKETVYVISDAEGNPDKVIVSDWIQNTEKAEKLEDKTDLKDVEVLKGDNSFTIDESNGCEWDAEGGDIYYRGTGSAELPVGVNIVYELNGKAVSPDSLAGKSGKLKIKITYENRQYSTQKINGKEEKIYVPFVMMTGMMLDNEKAENITVSNGKVINDGTHTFVVGFALPGMQETLQLKSDELELPSTVEITADIKDFELATTLTVATNDMFSNIDVSKLDSKSKELTGKLNELVSASNKLLDGSSKLYDGLNTLLDKSGELIDGVNKLYDGAAQIKSGTRTLKGGAEKLSDGAQQLDSGVGALNSGAQQLNSGAAALAGGAAEVDSGAGTLSAGSSQLDSGVTQLQGYLSQLSGGLDQISSNSAQLVGGATKVFNTFLSTAGTQIAAAGLSAPELTIDNYSAVLSKLIASLSDENAAAFAEQTARSTVTATVESQRGLIRQGVENAVRKQVTEAVLNAAGYAMSAEAYDAAVAAGQIPEEVQVQVGTAVGAQMSSMQDTIDANTDAQVQAIIEQNMNAEQVQAQIAAGIEKAKGGRKSLEALKQQLDSYNTFYCGIISYTTGVDQANSGAKDILTGTGTLKSGSGELKNGAAQLKGGTKQLKDGADQLAAGTKDLSDGTAQLKGGSAALAKGAKELSDGTVTLDNGMTNLYLGIGTLKEGTSPLLSGITQLRDGSMQLNDGMKKFKTEGADKLKKAADGDIKSLVERIKAISRVSKSYQSYSGISSDANGKVDFIFKTAGIESK